MTRVAAYARFSSDQQRAASLEDQLRNCRDYCARLGWPAPVVYQDAAISGSRNDRPGYQKLLADAERFDVIIVDDLSRLSRDSVETAQALRSLAFRGIRVVAISDSLDTSRKDAKINAGLRGLMGELYLDDLRDKTHRGLTGRALAGASAGGLPYGYRVTKTGAREIDQAQAEVVRRIMADYLAGKTARQIAAALNAEGIPSPRNSTWAMSAIHGDAKRGIGILANPIYCGRQVWNRSRWVKHPSTGRRVRQERPKADWITTEHPELAIVDRETFEAVQRRLSGRTLRQTGRAGRPPRHLLSGLLRCGECGGPVVAIDRYRYGCANAKDRGTCTSALRFSRVEADELMLNTVRERYLGADAWAAYQRHAAAALRRQGSARDEARQRLAKATQWRENVMQAIRAGIVSATVKADLEAAEAAVATAQREIDAPALARMLPDARGRWERRKAGLASLVTARETLREIVGEAILRNENGQPVAELAAVESLGMVAGAGFSHWRPDPYRFRLSRG